jgi:hypothetical protein
MYDRTLGLETFPEPRTMPAGLQTGVREQTGARARLFFQGFLHYLAAGTR